jgi:syntaxin 1B/2/3
MSSMNGQGNRPNDPNAILNECREVGRGIDEIELNIKQLRGFYIESSSLTSSDALEIHRKKINKVQETTITLYRNLGGRMKKMRTNPESGHPRNDKQVGATLRRLQSAIIAYQKGEAEHRALERDQGRRQYLTIVPDATEEEVEAAIEDNTGNLFSQAVSMMIFEFRNN